MNDSSNNNKNEQSEEKNPNDINALEEYYGVYRKPDNTPITVKDEIYDWLETIGLAFSLMIILFILMFKYVTVVGTSMEDTLHWGDRLILTSISNTYKTGDIIVIINDVEKDPYVKRVIATEGQTVEFDFDNWIVWVDGIKLDEPYIKRAVGRMNGFDAGPIVVGEGKIFVVGDNRNGSSDSRDPAVGQLEVRNILGKVIFRVYPFNVFGFVR